MRCVHRAPKNGRHPSIKHAEKLYGRFRVWTDAEADNPLADRLERIADEIWQELGVGNEDDESYVSGVDDAVMTLRAHARKVRGEQS